MFVFIKRNIYKKRLSTLLPGGKTSFLQIVTILNRERERLERVFSSFFCFPCSFEKIFSILLKMFYLFFKSKTNLYFINCVKVPLQTAELCSTSFYFTAGPRLASSITSSIPL